MSEKSMDVKKPTNYSRFANQEPVGFIYKKIMCYRKKKKDVWSLVRSSKI